MTTQVIEYTHDPLNDFLIYAAMAAVVVGWALILNKVLIKYFHKEQ